MARNPLSNGRLTIPGGCVSTTEREHGIDARVSPCRSALQASLNGPLRWSPCRAMAITSRRNSLRNSLGTALILTARPQPHGQGANLTGAVPCADGRHLPEPVRRRRPQRRPAPTLPAGAAERRLIDPRAAQWSAARRCVSMGNPDTHPTKSPVNLLTAVREWLWRHSSQPNGDPWDGDPRAPRPGSAPSQRACRVAPGHRPPTSAAEQAAGRTRNRRDVASPTTELPVSHRHRERGRRPSTAPSHTSTPASTA